MAVAVAPADAPARPGFRRLARDSAIYASGSVAGKAIGLLLLPLVTRALGPAAFGRLDVLSTLQSAATSVLVLGLDTGSTRLYADLGDAGRRRMFGSWLVLTAQVVVPLALTLALFRTTVSEALFGTPAYGTAVAFTAMAIVGASFQVVALTVLRNHHRPEAYAGVSAGALTVNGALVVALMAAGGGMTAVLGAMALSMTAGGVVGLIVAGRRCFGRPEATTRRRLLALGLPVLPAMAAIWVAEFANRAILLDRAGPREVGWFSVGTRFASVALLVVVGFQTAWQPRAFADGERDPAALRRVARDGERILLAVAVAVVVLAAASPDLLPLVAGSAFDPALPTLGLALVAALGLAALNVATMPSALSRRMGHLGWAAGVAATTGIALNCWWAPRHGALGAATAIAVGQLAGVVVGFALARRQAPVPYAWAPMVVTAVGAVAAVLVATLPAGGAPPAVRAGIAVVAVLVALRRLASSSG